MFEKPCDRFARLREVAEDGVLSEADREFLDGHANSCAKCAELDAQISDAFAMLREASLTDVAPSHGFDTRVMRRSQVAIARDGFRYWSPALGGAVIAALCMIATIALLSRPDAPRRANVPFGQASNAGVQHYPSLDLPGRVSRPQ